MARLPRLNLPGYPHLVLQSGHNSQPIALGAPDYQQLLQLIEAGAARHRVALHAWCLLPTRFMLLLTPSTEEGLPLLMQDTGRAYVRYFNGLHARTGTLWDGRYRCTVLDPARWTLPAMVCMDTEPVRRGLVLQPDAYPWSSCARYTGLRPQAGLTAPAALWELGNTPFARENAYRHLLDEGDALALWPRLLDAALHGWVLGDAAFIDALQQQTDRRLHKKRAGRPPRMVRSARTS